MSRKRTAILQGRTVHGQRRGKEEGWKGELGLVAKVNEAFVYDNEV